MISSIATEGWSSSGEFDSVFLLFTSRGPFVRIPRLVYESFKFVLSLRNFRMLACRQQLQ